MKSQPARHLLICCLCLLPHWVHAASFTVDLDLDLVDANPGDGACDVGAAVPLGGGRCSLRAAVMEAEANAEADSIHITPGMLINLSLSGVGGAEVGDLNITTEIAILGFVGSTPPLNPALLPRIDAGDMNDRHFSVLNGQFMLRGLRISGGSTEFSGGAVSVSGNASSTADVQHVLFSNNVAARRGGAINVGGLASLNVADSQFFRNDAGVASGAAIGVSSSGNATIRRSSFVDNRDSSFGASIIVQSNSSLRVENSTLDGSLLRPPIAGLEARRGIGLFDQASLIVRNSTLTNFVFSAIELTDLDGAEFVRIGHSILQGDISGCRADGADLAAANVRIAYSIVESEVNCNGFYRSAVRSGLAELEPLNLDDPPRLTLSRRPIGPQSNVVDAGLRVDSAVADAEFACTSEDQLGNPRVQDADLDEDFRCDFGAIELPSPVQFVVNHFADDLTDDLPGDGLCASVDTPGIGVVCTLRAAVMEANALPGLQQIVFEPSASPAVLTLPVAGPVGGALDITETVAIDGNLAGGRPATTIEGQMDGERLFLIDAPDVPVYLRNLRLTGGDADGGNGGALAVLLDSDLKLMRSELFDNFAATGGGAISVLGGLLEVFDSDFRGNSSDDGATAIFSNFSSLVGIRDSSLRDHLGVDAGGSAQPVIKIDPGVSLMSLNNTFSGNQLAIEADEPRLLLIEHNTMLDQLNGAVLAEFDANSQVLIINSIFSASGSAQFDCAISGSENAQFFQIDYVLDSDGSCAVFADQIGLTADPLLLPIHRPAGRISYAHAPSVAASDPSPVLDLVGSDTCTLDFDQYDNPRPVDLIEVPDADGPCDLGAIESSVFDLLFMDSFE